MPGPIGMEEVAVAKHRGRGILGIVAGIATGIYAAGNIEQSGYVVMTIPVILFVLGIYYLIKSD
jgi:hypothetical protein